MKLSSNLLKQNTFQIAVALLLIFTANLLISPLYAQQIKRKSVSESAISRRSAELVTAEQLKNYLYYIASDEMEGRDTPSRGLDTIAKFIALNLSRWGFRPAGDDNTFFQKIALQHEKINLSRTFAEISGQKLSWGADFIGFPGPNNASADSASSSLIYVGNGWLVKSKSIDPYRNLDVKNKIVVISGTGGLPKGVTANDLRGQNGEEWATPNVYAQQKGAKGIVWVPDLKYLADWETVKQAVEQGKTFVSKLQEQNGRNIPRIALSPRMAAMLFQGEKYSAEEIFYNDAENKPTEPFVLSSNKKLVFNVATDFEQQSTQNIVAVWEGSDPLLKNEFVALGGALRSHRY